MTKSLTALVIAANGCVRERSDHQKNLGNVSQVKTGDLPGYT